jgi:hypothetical protein
MRLVHGLAFGVDRLASTFRAPIRNYQECPYQITLPRRQLTDDAAIMDFLLSSHVGKFDMYVEDECAAYVRYCFADPMDAAIFRSRFEPKSEPFRLAG